MFNELNFLAKEAQRGGCQATFMKILILLNILRTTSHYQERMHFIARLLPLVLGEGGEITWQKLAAI